MSAIPRHLQPIPEPPVTPALHLCFSLIVCFLLALPFLLQARDSRPAPGPATLAIAADLSLTLDGTPVTRPGLQPNLKSLHEKHPDRSLLVRPAPGLAEEDLLEFLSLARGAGFTRVAIAPRPQT